MKKLLAAMGIGLALGSVATAQSTVPPPSDNASVGAAATPDPSALPAAIVPATDAPAADSSSTPDVVPDIPTAPPSPHEIKLAVSPLYGGPYVAPLFSYSRLGHNWESKDGLGGELGLGYRLKEHGFAVEVRGLYSNLGSSRSAEGGTLDALFFPFSKASSVDGFYAIAGGGYLRSSQHPEISGSYGMTAIQAGMGYILGLKLGNYDFGIRAEALGRHDERGHVERNENDGGPRSFNDVILNLGLQLPLGKPKETPPAPEPPIAVVAPVAEAAPPPPSKPECRKPAPGEKLTLDGCGTGDVIVLNGVNFDFNKATLTPNAKTILDQVSEELVSHPDIKVELAGHTDGKGSAPYNQKLSQKRAESVRKYFMEHGVTGDRMTAVGYGKTQPIDTNDTDEGRAHNRRVELRITSNGNNDVTPVVVIPTGAS